MWNVNQCVAKTSTVLTVVLFLTIVGLLVWIIILRNKSVTPMVADLFRKWNKDMIPPKLDERIVVYVSAPLFNLAETIYSVGVGGITPPNNESLIETLCNLTPDQQTALQKLSDVTGLPRYGLAGLCAKKGWYSYIPARDGFVLAKFISAVQNQTGTGKLIPTKQEQSVLLGYLTKAIYGNDVFALGAVCNTCIFNGNGLQMDDGSATEIGMIGVRGLPSVIFRDQMTDQFGPGASNPMPLGCASSIITQRAYFVQDAVKLLEQKIKNVKSQGGQWWGGTDYCTEVPPPPLIQYWLEMGSAVYLTRYRSKTIYVDPVTGIQDYQKSSTDFFYQRYFKDGSDKALTEIALKIMENIKAVEKKWLPLIPVWGGCPNPGSITLNEIQSNPQICAAD